MSFLSSIFGQGAYGHWDSLNRMHSRTLPQVGCPVCEAEGWIAPVKRNKGHSAGGVVSGGFFIGGTPGPELLIIPGCQEADPTPDPDAAKVRLALAAEDIQRGIDNLTLAIKDDPRLDEALDLYRERLRGIRAALESEAR